MSAVDEYCANCRALRVHVNAWLAAHADALSNASVVDMSNSYCGAAGLQAVTTLLARNTHLRELRVRHCGLDNDAVVLLCRALRRVIVHGSSATTEAATATAAAGRATVTEGATTATATVRPPLQTIDVRDNATLSLAAGVELLSLAQHCPTLVCVEVAGTCVPSALQRRLARTLADNATRLQQQQQRACTQVNTATQRGSDNSDNNSNVGDDSNDKKHTTEWVAAVTACVTRRQAARRQAWVAHERDALAALRTALLASSSSSAYMVPRMPRADPVTGWRVLELPVLAAPSLFASEVALLCERVLPRLNAQLRRHKLHIIACAEDACVTSVAAALSLPRCRTLSSSTACTAAAASHDDVAQQQQQLHTPRQQQQQQQQRPPPPPQRKGAVHAVPLCDVLADVQRCCCLWCALVFVGDRAGDVALPQASAMQPSPPTRRGDAVTASDDDGDVQTSTTTTTPAAAATTTTLLQPVLYDAYAVAAAQTPWLLLATRAPTRQLDGVPPSLAPLLSDEPTMTYADAPAGHMARVAAPHAAQMTWLPQTSSCCPHDSGRAAVTAGDGGDDAWLRGVPHTHDTTTATGTAASTTAVVRAWQRHVAFRHAAVARLRVPSLCVRDYCARYDRVADGAVRLTQLDELAEALYTRLRLLCLSLCGAVVDSGSGGGGGGGGAATGAVTGNAEDDDDSSSSDDDTNTLLAQRERVCALRDAALSCASRLSSRGDDRRLTRAIEQHVCAYLTTPRSRNVLAVVDGDDEGGGGGNTKAVCCAAAAVAAAVRWCARREQQQAAATHVASAVRRTRIAYVDAAACGDVHEVVQSLLQQLCSDAAVLQYVHVEHDTTRLCRFASLLLAGHCALAREAQRAVRGVTAAHGVRNSNSSKSADAANDGDDDDGEEAHDDADDSRDVRVAYCAAVTAALAAAEADEAAATSTTTTTRTPGDAREHAGAVVCVVLVVNADALITTSAATGAQLWRRLRRWTHTQRDQPPHTSPSPSLPLTQHEQWGRAHNNSADVSRQQQQQQQHDDDDAAATALAFVPVCLARHVRVCVLCRGDGAVLRALRQRGRDGVDVCDVCDERTCDHCSNNNSNQRDTDDDDDAAARERRVRCAVARELQALSQCAITARAAAALRHAFALSPSDNNDNNNNNDNLVTLLCDKTDVLRGEYVRYSLHALCGVYEVAGYAATPAALLRSYPDTLVEAARRVYAACVRVCGSRARAHVALGVLSCARDGLLRCELRTLLRLSSPRRVNALLRVLRPALCSSSSSLLLFAHDGNTDGDEDKSSNNSSSNNSSSSGHRCCCENVLLSAVRLTSPAMHALLTQLYSERAAQTSSSSSRGGCGRVYGKAATAAAAAVAQTADVRTWHAMLAHYYMRVLQHSCGSCDDDDDNGSARSRVHGAFVRRALVALPHHLAAARLWSLFDEHVLSLSFVRRVCAARATHAYVRDCTNALYTRCCEANNNSNDDDNNNDSSMADVVLSSPVLRRHCAYVRFVRRHGARLLAHPQLTLQTALEPCCHERNANIDDDNSNNNNNGHNRDGDDDVVVLLQRDALRVAAHAAARRATAALPVYVRHVLPPSPQARPHVGRVNAVCFVAHSGDVCISAGDDRAVSWLQRTARRVQTTSSSSTTTVTTQHDTHVEVTRQASSWALRQVHSPTSAVCGVCLSPTACYAAATTRERDVIVYDTATRRVVSRIDGGAFAAPIAAIAFSARGRRLCVATTDVRVRVYVTEKATLLCTLDDARLVVQPDTHSDVDHVAHHHDNTDDNDDNNDDDGGAHVSLSPRVRRRLHDVHNTVHLCTDVADEEVFVTVVNAHVCVWRVPLSASHTALCCARVRLSPGVSAVQQLQLCRHDDGDGDDDKRYSLSQQQRQLSSSSCGVWVLPQPAHTLALYALPAATAATTPSSSTTRGDDAVVAQCALLQCVLPSSRTHGGGGGDGGDEGSVATTFALAPSCHDGSSNNNDVTHCVAVALCDGRVALYTTNTHSHDYNNSNDGEDGEAGDDNKDNCSSSTAHHTRVVYATCVYDAFAHNPRETLRDVAFATITRATTTAAAAAAAAAVTVSADEKRSSGGGGCLVLCALGSGRQLRVWRVCHNSHSSRSGNLDKDAGIVDDDGNKTCTLRVRHADGEYVAAHHVTSWSVAATAAATTATTVHGARLHDNNAHNNDRCGAADVVLADESGAVTLLSLWSATTAAAATAAQNNTSDGST